MSTSAGSDYGLLSQGSKGCVVCRQASTAQAGGYSGRQHQTQRSKLSVGRKIKNIEAFGHCPICQVLAKDSALCWLMKIQILNTYNVPPPHLCPVSSLFVFFVF